MTRIGIPIEADRQERLVSDLQSLLNDLVDLSLQGKQAHWNVVGRHFAPLHEQLDALVSDARAFVDLVAERIVTLGTPADGRAATVAEASRVEAFPEGFVGDDKVVDLVVSRLTTVVEANRARLDELGELDAVTQDVVIEVLRGLEKHLWMFQAQTR